jgi:hypothetical protein
VQIVSGGSAVPTVPKDKSLSIGGDGGDATGGGGDVAQAAVHAVKASDQGIIGTDAFDVPGGTGEEQALPVGPWQRAGGANFAAVGIGSHKYSGFAVERRDRAVLVNDKNSLAGRDDADNGAGRCGNQDQAFGARQDNQAVVDAAEGSAIIQREEISDRAVGLCADSGRRR